MYGCIVYLYNLYSLDWAQAFTVFLICFATMCASLIQIDAYQPQAYYHGLSSSEQSRLNTITKFALKSKEGLLAASRIYSNF